MTEQKQNWGFHAAGDLLDTPAPQPEPEAAPQPAPSRFAMTTKKPKQEVATVTPVAPQPVVAEPVAPTPVVTTPAAPKSTGFFMAAGDLLSAADGHHEESKGHSWDDFRLKDTVTVIGRNSNCDLVTPQIGTSSEHARITRYNGRYVLSDCNSQAGTYVNGLRLSGAVYLNEKDRISIGSSNYVYTGDRLVFAKADDPTQRTQALRAMQPGQRPVVLRADIQTKKVKSNTGVGLKELIRDIHIDVKEGSLVAMLGTAGAGKSTVMNCMNGMELQGVQGSVRFRNVDLVHNFEQMKHLIGSVPQKKVFHPTFTPEEEFMQAAMLRLPDDTTDREIKERVDRTLEMLSITGVRKNRNSKLSGGEQTRVNVGIELVADRDLLCLDEPDQGLSPNYKHELFVILRNLAHDHCKTVISIIHDVSEIDMFDQVIMLAKVDNVGRLAFSGSPADAREYFGAEIRDAYALLEREPARFVR